MTRQSRYTGLSPRPVGGILVTREERARWERVLEAQRLIQQHFPDLVLVGGTAAALHSGHRYSLDGDHVLSDLRDRFERVLEQLEQLADWKTNRLSYPVLILGNFQGVDTGIRQLERTDPLEVEVVNGIRIPTVAEMIRIKAWLVVRRNQTRDYLDLCALSSLAGEKQTVEALEALDRLYPQRGIETVTRQLAKQLAEPLPADLDDLDLSQYRGVQPPWDRWEPVKANCQRLSDLIVQDLLGLGAVDPGPEG